MEGLSIGSILASVIAGVILLWIANFIKNYVRRRKNNASIKLATSAFEYLDVSAREKTTNVISMSKQLGDALVTYYRCDQPIDQNLKTDLIGLLGEVISELQPFVSKLTTARAELDELSAAVLEFKKGLEWRVQIINHLCSSPIPRAIDAGHVRDQLLSVNCLPNDLLNAARGEAALFLRGYGINWFKRREYKRQIVKKHRSLAKETIEKEYRSVLQQTAFAKTR